MLGDVVFEGLRVAVVRTANVPGLREIYAAIYAFQTARAARLLRQVDGVEALFVRGSTPARVSPGLSDIDLFVLLDDSRPVSVELLAIERIGKLVRRINVGAPLIREVHVFTRTELALLGSLRDTLYAAVLFDSAAVGAKPVLPELDDDPRIWQEALLREVCFRTARVLRHLYEGGIVGNSLAARAHAKSLAAMEHLERGGGSMEGLRRAYATGSRVPARFEDVIALHRRIDEMLPHAPELVRSEPWSPHPTIEAAAAPVRRWFRPLEGLSGIEGAVLSAEGVRSADLRFYLLLDPTHPGAPSTLERIGAALRDTPFPKDGFSRFPWPIVITPRQCERTIFQRWTSTEPVTRLRHGVTIAGDPVAPRATADEMTRALVLDWIGSANRVRELFAGDRSPKNLQCVSDAVLGLAPSIESLANGGGFVTLPPPVAGAHSAFIATLNDRSKREILLQRLRVMATEPCSALVRLARGGPV